MKYTIVGDPHAKPGNLDKIETLFDQVEKLGNPVIVLGDLLDTKELIRGKCLNLLHKRLKESDLDWILLVGNHDLFVLDGPYEHSLEVLKSLENVTVIDHPVYDASKKFLFVPFTRSTKAFSELIASYKKKHKETILFMHQGVTGFDYGNGYIAKDETSLKLLKDFKLVISGHFHKMQQKGNLLYLGTPFSHSFGEENQTKYIGVLHPAEPPILHHIYTSFPQHKSIEVSMSTWLKNSNGPKKLEKLLKSDDYFRIILTGTPKEIAQFPKHDYSKAKIIERPTTCDAFVNTISETFSNEKKFLQWAKTIKKLDQDDIKLGLQLLKGDI